MKTSFWMSHLSKVFTIFVGENVLAKVAQKRFRKVFNNSGKNPSSTKKFACSNASAPNHLTPTLYIL